MNDEDQKPKSIQEKLLDKKDAMIEQYTEELKKEGGPTAKNAVRLRGMIQLYAIGLTKKEISIQLGISQNRVNQMLGSESVMKEVKRIQDEFFYQNPQKMFLTEVGPAFREVKKILRSKKSNDSVKLQAANSIWDRALGKPTQEIKHEGSAIRELLTAMDRVRDAAPANKFTNQPIDAEFKEIKNDDKSEPKDEMDDWIDQNL